MTDPIRTSIGYAAFDDNVMRGRSVRDEVFGRHTFLGAFSLALGGPALDEAQSRALDDLGVACIAIDPRIWPLKVAWLGACFGSPWAGAATLTSSLAGAMVGPAPGLDAARTCVSLHDAARDAAEPAEAMWHWLRARKEAGERIAGFGVPGRAGGRSSDERIELIRAAMARHGVAGEHLALVDALVEVLPGRTGMRPNGALYLAAALLDLGFAPEHDPMICVQLFNLMIWANAYEASRLAPASLQRLASELVTYVGPSDRRSPRAEASSR